MSRSNYEFSDEEALENDGDIPGDETDSTDNENALQSADNPSGGAHPLPPRRRRGLASMPTTMNLKAKAKLQTNKQRLKKRTLSRKKGFTFQIGGLTVDRVVQVTESRATREPLQFDKLELQQLVQEIIFKEMGRKEIQLTPKSFSLLHDASEKYYGELMECNDEVITKLVKSNAYRNPSRSPFVWIRKP